MMRRTVRMWREPRMAWASLAVAVAFAAVSIAFSPVVVSFAAVSVHVTLSSVVPITAAVLVGPAAAWGSAIGVVLTDLYTGTLSMATAGVAIGNFFYGFVGALLWTTLRTNRAEGPLPISFPEDLPLYGFVALVAVAASASVEAWVLTAVGTLPFGTLAPSLIGNRLLAALVLGTPLLYLLVPRADWSSFTYSPAALGGAGEVEGTPLGVVAVSFVWPVVGIGLSALVLGLRHVPLSVLTDKVPGVLFPIVRLAATHGRTSELAVGLILFSALVVSSSVSLERVAGIGSR